MDTLRLMFQVDDWQSGKSTLYQLWSDNAAHRGLIMQAILFANMEAFGLNIELANRLTGFVIFCCSALLVSAFLRDRRTAVASPSTRSHWLVVTSAAILLGALGFGLAGFELLTLDLGLAQWLKNFAFLIVFVLYGTLFTRPSAGRAALISLLIPIVVLFIGMGWSYPFVAAIFAVHGLVHLQRKRNAIPYSAYTYAPLISAGISITLHLLGGSTHSNAGSTALGPIGQIHQSLLVLPFYSVGSAFVGVEASGQLRIPSAVLLAIGIGTAALAIYGLWRRWRRSITSASLLPLYLLAYSAMFIASIAVSRGHGGVEAVMSSRYYMEIILFIAGTVWLLAEDICACPRPARLGLAAYFALVLTFAGGYALTGHREWNVAPHRAHSFETLRSRLRIGAVDHETAGLLQSPFPHATKGVGVMVRRELSIFRGYSKRQCTGELAYLQGWHAAERGGTWSQREARLSISPCTCDIALTFYIPAQLSRRDLSVRDSSGTIAHKVSLVPGESTQVLLRGSKTRSTWMLSLSHATIPTRDLPGSLDTRELGVLLGDHTAYACAADMETAQ